MEEPPKIFAVLGLSRFGLEVARGLCAAGSTVIAIDRNEGLVQNIADHVTKAVRADATDLELMEHLGVLEADVIVLGFRSSFETAVLLALMLRKRCPDIHIIAQIDRTEKGEALRQIGVDATVFPERDMGERVVKSLMLPNLVEHASLSPATAVVEVAVPDPHIGQSLAEAAIRSRFGVHVIGVSHRSKDGRKGALSIAPQADYTFRQGDSVLILGEIGRIRDFSRRF
jgi:trk system potassium uptake protein TrkA